MGQPPQQQPPMASAVTMASPSTNCDISNTTDNAMLQKHSMMPNHQPAAPSMQQQMSQSASQRLMATQQPQQPRGRSPNLGQPNLGYPQSSQDPMGRPPPMHQNRQPSFDMGGAGGAQPPMAGAASGGYNFQRIMDDHFEHYKRAPSRERSVDKTNLPASLAGLPLRGLEAAVGAGLHCSEMLPTPLLLLLPLTHCSPKHNLPYQKKAGGSDALE